MEMLSSSDVVVGVQESVLSVSSERMPGLIVSCDVLVGSSTVLVTSRDVVVSDEMVISQTVVISTVTVD